MKMPVDRKDAGLIAVRGYPAEGVSGIAEAKSEQRMSSPIHMDVYNPRHS
jgi:hypothetical protein